MSLVKTIITALAGLTLSACSLMPSRNTLDAFADRMEQQAERMARDPWIQHYRESQDQPYSWREEEQTHEAYDERTNAAKNALHNIARAAGRALRDVARSNDPRAFPVIIEPDIAPIAAESGSDITAEKPTSQEFDCAVRINPGLKRMRVCTTAGPVRMQYTCAYDGEKQRLEGCIRLGDAKLGGYWRRDEHQDKYGVKAGFGRHVQAWGSYGDDNSWEGWAGFSKDF